LVTFGVTFRGPHVTSHYVSLLAVPFPSILVQPCAIVQNAAGVPF
jgi:hypothetical protein